MPEQNELPAYFNDIEQYFHKVPEDALILRFEEGVLTKVIFKGKEHEVPFYIFTQDVRVEYNNGDYKIIGNWFEKENLIKLNQILVSPFVTCRDKMNNRFRIFYAGF